MASSIALITHGINGAASTPNVTLDTTGANYIGIWLSYGNSSDGRAPEDTDGNTWTRRLYVAGPINSTLSYGSFAYFDCANYSGGGAGKNFLFNHLGVFTTISVSAWSGVYSASDPYDTSTSNSSNSASSLAPGSITPANDGSLLMFGSWFEQTSGTYAVSGGYTQLDLSNEVGGAGIGLIQSYLIQDTKTASNPTGTPTSSSAMAVGLVALRPTSYTPPPGGTILPKLGLLGVGS